MKKALSLFLAFLMIFGIAAVGIGEIKPFTAEATEELQEGNFVYEVVGGNAVITDYTDTESTQGIVIPEALGGYPVTEIGAKAFCDCMCTSVTISTTVNYIDVTAFAYNMPNIEKYVVTEGNDKFSSDEKGILYSYLLAQYPIIEAYPKNSPVTTLDLTNITFAGGIQAFAFSEVKNLENLIAEDSSVFAVDNYAFNCAEDLKSITIKHCNFIGERAFYGCSSLTDVNLTDLQSIDWNAFEGTPFINDPSNYDSDGVFYYDGYCLLNTLPEADKEYYAIKSGTVTVAGGSFDWDSMTEVSIPSSVAHIGSNPFGLCANLRDITVDGGNFRVDEYGVLYGKAMMELISYPNGRYQTCFVAGYGTNSILPHAFDYSPVRNFYLTSEIGGISQFGLGGANVTDIHFQGSESRWLGVSIFDDHSDINYMGRQDAVDAAELHLNDYSDEAHSILTKADNYSVCSCGYESDIAASNGEYTENGFTYRVINGKAEITGCSSYVTGGLVIPETIGGLTVVGIGGDAFDLCNCTSVSVPASVEYIEKSSGLWTLATLQKITVASDNANYTAEDGVLYSKDKTELIIYPDAKADASFTVPSYVNTITKGAFVGVRKLNVLTVPGTVKTIESNAASLSYGLTDLIIEEGVEYIGDYAFRFCHKLVNVSLADGIKYIGRKVFDSTVFTGKEANYDDNGVLYHNGYLLAATDQFTGLTYEIDEGTVLIAGGVFEWERLMTVAIPASVRSIGDAAFSGCKNLENINVDAGSQYYCKGEDGVLFTKDMKMLVAYPMGNIQACYAVPEGVTEIRAYALDCDTMLSNKYIPASVEVIGVYGLGANPDMIINYQGTEAQWADITFETDVTPADDYLKTIDDIIKNYGTYTSVTHAMVENTTTDPTCTEKGAETIACSCGYNHINVIPAAGHKATGSAVTITEATCTQKEVQVRYCGVCGEVATTIYNLSLGHDYELIEREVTCTENGGSFYKCTRCGNEDGDGIIYAEGHKASAEITTVEPTCTTDGYQYHKCEVCGETIGDMTNVIPATGHTAGEWILETAPTCTANGLEILNCTVCGETIDSRSVSGGHTASDEIITIEPTCSSAGGQYYKCAVCGLPIRPPISVTPATGHVAGEWVVEIPATCTSVGYEYLPCTTCDTIIDSRVIESGHQYEETVIEETCTTVTKQYYCTRCHDDYYKRVEYVDGSHGELVATVEEAGCLTEGREYMKCTVCDAPVGEITYIPNLGHDLSEKINKEATCTAEGERVIECSRCDYKKTEVIPEASHTFGKWVYESGNIFTGKCSACDESFDSVEVELTLDKTMLSMLKNNTDKITATVTENITDDIVFTSDNENIVKVDADGTVTANSPGTAVITAKINGTDITAECTVKVVSNAYLVSWMVDSDVYVVTSVNEGRAITVPEPPLKDGYDFVGWTPAIPDIMPAHGLAFTAVFNKVSKSEEYDVSASYEQGCFDEEVSLDVKEIEDEREPGGVYMVDGEYYKQVGLYNIKAVNADSQTVQPNEGYKVTIKLPIPSAYSSRTDFVINHRFVDGGREQLSTANGTLTVKDGYLIF